jgi:hypothetical protein
MMNAGRAARFPRPTIKNSEDIFQNPHRLAPVSSATGASQEIDMTSFRKRMAAAPLVFAATMGAASLLGNAALASQGPGGGLGTASSLTQLTMAAIVYGGSALVVAAGLIGAVRGR